MFAEMIEAADRVPARRPLYVVALLIIIAVIFALTTSQFLRPAAKVAHTDFDAFYIASTMVLSGDAARAYDMTSFIAREKALFGTSFKLAWAYPPPYNFVVAPLGLVSLPVSFSLFIGGSLLAFLCTLSRLAGDRLATLLVLMLVPIYVVVVTGQNGLLTGTLLGLACLGLRDRRTWAGLPLGLMIIKPHLAIGLAFYVVITRQWRVFFVAAATVLTACGLATLVFGVEIWAAFLGGVRQTSELLETGRHPLYRMLSPFAALRSLGVPAAGAFAAQAISAAVALAAIFDAQRRLPAREALGVTAIASLLISPYAYDYDVAVMGVGLALLLPALIAADRRLARGSLYAAFLFLAGYGFVRMAMLNLSHMRQTQPWPPTIAGVMLLISLGLVWAMLRRPRDAAAGLPISAPAQ